MNDREFHKMVDELVAGAPPVVGMVRVMTALQVAVDKGGEPVAAAVKLHCSTVVRNLKELGLRLE